MKAFAWDGDSWNEFKNLHAFDGSDWGLLVNKGYSWDGDSWNQIYARSDPAAFTFNASWSQGYMYSNGWPCVGSVLSGVADNAMIQGYWDTSQGDPAGDWDHVQSAMVFNGMDAQLAIRPKIKSGTLRLTLDVGYGGDPKNTNVVIGNLPSSPTTAYTRWTHSDVGKNLQDTGDLFTANGQTKVITLNRDVLDALEVTQGLSLHDPSHGTSETIKRAHRAIFHGASASSTIKPSLTLTLDYV